MNKKEKVLFVCTGNSCRSQIAEGLLRELANDHYEVFSAGSHPARLHPASVAVMAEWGIDISNQTSDSINEYLDKNIDIVTRFVIMPDRRVLLFPVMLHEFTGVSMTPFMDGVLTL